MVSVTSRSAEHSTVQYHHSQRGQLCLWSTNLEESCPCFYLLLSCFNLHTCAHLCSAAGLAHKRAPEYIQYAHGLHCSGQSTIPKPQNTHRGVLRVLQMDVGLHFCVVSFGSMRIAQIIFSISI